MISWKEFSKIYFYNKVVDFRKAINGLSCLVQEEMSLDPFESCLYIFSDRKKSKLKILYWDKSGFALWYKKLEKEKFKIPRHRNGDVIILSEQQLAWLLDGIDIWKMKPHEKLKYKEVC